MTARLPTAALALLLFAGQGSGAERPEVRLQGEPGAYGGFALTTSQGTVAEVTFPAVRSGRAAEERGAILRFSDLRSLCGAKLADESAVELRWDPDAERYVLRWRLAVAGFDPLKWEAAMGRSPFHFVRLHVPGAELFHIGGWHIPTPGADPYPLHNRAISYGRQVASRWSRDWTFAAPLQAVPLPTAGLWAPGAQRYAAFDFSAAFVKDGSAPGIASAGLWADGRASVALVWPPGLPGRNLRYPSSPEFDLAGQCHLVLHDRLPTTDDPNRVLHQFLWDHLRERLPGVASTVDVSWMPKALRDDPFAERTWAPLCAPLEEAQWYRAGSLVFQRGLDIAWAVRGAYLSNDKPTIDAVRGQARLLLRHVCRHRIAGDECCSWADPLAGERLPMFGPGSGTEHSDASWLAGSSLLEVALHDRELRADALPVADGVLRLSKHRAYTRGSREDAPACQSARALAAGVRFCLRYAHAFESDGQRGELAVLARRLARTLAYRYLTVWPCDNDGTDSLDASFLLQTTGGADWLGTAGGRDTLGFIAPLIEAYVATGDPVLGQYARGMLARVERLLTHDGRIMSVAVARGAGIDRRSWRAEGLGGDLAQLVWPVGDAALRVVAGRGGVMAVRKGSKEIGVAAYQHGDNGLGFKLEAGAGSPASFDVVVTHPYWSLKGMRVRRLRDGREQNLTEGADYHTYASRPDSMYLRGVRAGDEIVIGQLPRTAAVLPCAALKLAEKAPRVRFANVLDAPRPAVAPLAQLEPLFERFSGQIAALPDPSRANPLNTRVGAMLRRVGLADHVHALSPQELVDPAAFSAKAFPIVMYLGAERYYQTVKKPGDGDRALVQFLRDGGTLLVLPSGTWAFFQNQSGKTIVNCHTFGFCTSGHGPGTLGPHAVNAVIRGFERPPKEYKLTFHLCEGQQIIRSVPRAFPYPGPHSVDLRWRPVVDKLPTPRRYTPVITLRDEKGRSWNEAAALIEYSQPPFKGARVLAVWFSIFAMPQIGEAALHDLLHWALTTTQPAGPAGSARKSPSLPFADDFSRYENGAPPPRQWRVQAGKWRVDNGALLGEDCPSEGYEANGVFVGSSAWRDYELSLRFKVESKGADWKDGPWIGVRCDLAHDGYHLNFTDRSVQLHKISHSVSTHEGRPLAQQKWAYDDKWHALSVRVQANHIRVQADGRQLFDYRDDMALGLPSLRKGGIALSARKWPKFPGKMLVRYDDVKVTPIRDAGPRKD